MPPAHLIIFAKAPVPGRVKTRLRLRPALALRLHDALVRDTVALAAAFSSHIELSTDLATAAWSDLPIARSLQSPGDLGHRLLAALTRSPRPVLIIGCDSPTLPVAHLDHLLALPNDVALGPTADGGFWGIACRRLHPAMFDAVEWSSPRTLATTVAAVERAGLTVALGPAWYDIDEPADLERLALEDSPRQSVRLARQLTAAQLRPVN